MSDTFESLWAECSEPSDRDDGERRELADLFWRSGVAAAQERIRQELLEEAGALDAGPPYLGISADIWAAKASALREFARRLEPVTASAYVDGQRVSATAGTPEEADAELTRLAGLEPKP